MTDFISGNATDSVAEDLAEELFKKAFQNQVKIGRGIGTPDSEDVTVYERLALHCLEAAQAFTRAVAGK